MEILQQLGANQSAILQFFIFAISIAFLTIVVFNPYFKAYDQRLQKTKGAESVAKETIEETKNLNLIFQSKAREVNDKIKSIYSTENEEAKKTTEVLIKDAKNISAQTLEKSRKEISEQISQSANQVKTISQDIAQQLTQKLESSEA